MVPGVAATPFGFAHRSPTGPDMLGSADRLGSADGPGSGSVVTIALGSILATVLMSKDTVLLEGVAGLAVLIGLQYAIAWSSTRFGPVNRLIKSEPTLSFYRGEFLRDSLERENVSPDALRAGMRSAGHSSIDDVEAVVLESDGTISVLGASQTSGPLLFAPPGGHTGNHAEAEHHAAKRADRVTSDRAPGGRT